MKLFIEPLTKADVRSAFLFYQGRREGLGHEFKERVREAFVLIREHPQAFAQIEPGVRWAMTNQFPFKVYFLADEDPVRVIAVLHAAMHPDAWRARTQT
jgi:plasmid stabilization system protein ParE